MSKVDDVIEFNKKFKGITTSTNLLVSGFLREGQMELSLISKTKYSIHNAMPPLVIQVCLATYCFTQYWDMTKSSDSFCTMRNANIICKKKGYKNIKSAFLSQVISKGIHHWKFKIHSMNQLRCIGIGISKVASLKRYEGFWGGQAGYAYLFQKHKHKKESGNSICSKMGPTCSDGDVIDMFVDLDNHCLRFQMNGNNLDYEFSDILKIEYRAAISCCGIGDTVELLFYEQMFTLPCINA